MTDLERIQATVTVASALIVNEGANDNEEAQEIINMAEYIVQEIESRSAGSQTSEQS